MSNVNFFYADDYELHSVLYDNLDKKHWKFRCTIFGMEVECTKEYTTSNGAIKAGKRWLKNRIHDEMP